MPYRILPLLLLHAVLRVLLVDESENLRYGERPGWLFNGIIGFKTMFQISAKELLEMSLLEFELPMSPYLVITQHATVMISKGIKAVGYLQMKIE